MEPYKKTLDQFEDIIRTNLKVNNPVLLKSGTLGILTNYLANIKHDLSQYYSKLYQEMNPGLAIDFKSLLFHSTIYNNKIKLAEAATFGASIIIPEILLGDVNSMEYSIPAWTEFQDNQDNHYTLYGDIKITIENNYATAVTYNADNKLEILSVNKVENPNLLGTYIYVVYYPEFKQLKRTFYSFIVPELDQFKFSITIENYKNIMSTRAWVNTKDNIPLSSFELIKTDSIQDKFNLEEFNIKYYKHNSSRYDLDMFLDIQETSLQLSTGDGLNGKRLQPGDEIIFMTELTQGDANTNMNIEFQINNIIVEEKFLRGKSNVYASSLNAISKYGGQGGKFISSADEIREGIFDKISLRNSIVTENDYEKAFTKNGLKPFIDSKFIDARSFIFIFNALKINDKILATNSFNIKEEIIAGDSFYPKIEYNQRTLVSPFYYKRISINETAAFIVNPVVSIEVNQNYVNIQGVQKIRLQLLYNFITRKSTLIILSGQDPNSNYRFSSSVFNCELNSGNSFSHEISSRFTDTYCIVIDLIEEVKIEVFNSNGILTSAWYSDFSYHQLTQKQTFFKYYKFEEPDEQEELYETLDTISYLDNILNDILTSIDDLKQEKALGNIPYLLRLPFIDEADIEENNAVDFWKALDVFFKTDQEKNINYNTKTVQTFYNTISIEERYHDHLFKHNSLGTISTPILPIDIDISYNKRNLLLSEFESLFELEIQIKLTCIKFLKKKEGFSLKFYETELENLLYNQFSDSLQDNNSINLKIIQNIRINKPQTIVVNTPEMIFQRINNDENLEFSDLLDFVPPFFTYDYNNIVVNFIE